MKYFIITISYLLIFTSSLAAGEETAQTANQEEYLAWTKKIWESLDQKQGKVELSNKVATLQVPTTFYYLDPNDAETILVDVWNNPPGAGQDTLGMLLPSEASPFDDNSWAVTISYEEDGYVSDEDADSIDYGELLADMKESTKEENNERIRKGFETIELVGWASPPFYDKTTHKLYWAKELKFGNDTAHTLNYNIRVLGRKGVLVLNFIAGMNQQGTIEEKMGTVLAMTEFNTGSKYADFDPTIDKVAAYGIGALVAGKVIAKTGLFAAALIFLKKFGIFIIIGIGAALKKLFRKTKD